MKSVLVLVAAVAPPLALSALDSSFRPLDLSVDHRLVFSSQTDQPGWEPYTTLLDADLSEPDSIRVLTHFPERASYYPDTREIEIQNRYGLYRGRLDPSIQLKDLGFHPSFARGAVLSEGRILPVVTSPNGRWVLIQEPESPVRGALVLYDTRGGSRTVVSSEHVLNYRRAPALWSPDSRYLLYARDGRLYYMAVRHIDEGRIPDEGYREFAEGTLASVKWTDDDALFHVSGGLVRLLRPSEFFPRSFYAEPLPTGRAAGRIPVDFDPQFDTFWPSPDGRSLLVLKNGRNLFRFPLTGNQTNENGPLTVPFLPLPREARVLQLWWRPNGDIYILAGGSMLTGIPSRLYYLDGSLDAASGFRLRDLPKVRRFVPSPRGDTVAILENDGVSLRSSTTLDEKSFLNHPDPRDLFWIDDDTVLIAGSRRVETITLSDGTVDLIALSAVERAGFNDEGLITAVSGGRNYRWNAGTGIWVESEDVIRSPRLESQGYRVYSEENPSSHYRNRIMVRRVDGFGNRPLFPSPPMGRGALPGFEDEMLHSASDPRVFDHGARTRRREVSLVFDAVDDDEGLGEILSCLADYGIRATFFIGGDFIRRNPESARMLAGSNHELGSLFYTHMDMTDYRYRIDTDFVVQGMGRNEDEFFRTTGVELSTLWHAPWYFVSPPVLDATERMSYLYVGRDVDPMDWVTLDAIKGTRDLYKPSAVLAEGVLEAVRPGSIVPIRIGKSGKRDDYLFQKLDLLINGLLKDGYDIVTIGELRENSL